jgi:beta-lactamase class C
MKIPRGLSFALLMLLAAAQASGSPDDRSAFPADLDREFARILEEIGVPGGAFAVIHGDRIAHVGTFGVRASGESAPVTANTVFRVASVSKTFAAQLTAMLVSEGVLGWDDAVIAHVPEFRLGDPEYSRQLRIHHLLGQSTGVVPNAYDNLLNASQGLDQIVPRFAELEPMCTPGSCYTYQNVLFSLVGPAVERSTGFSYEDLVQARLLEPLGMRHASVGMDAYLAAPDRARPHVRRAGVWWATDVNENYYRVAPAAGVNASILDLGDWLIAQLGHRPDVIAPALVDQITTKQVRTTRDLRRRGWRDLLTDAHYGLGWRIYTIENEEIYLHSGWVRGFVAEVAFSRDRQLGLAVLLNAESSALNEFTTGFWRQALAEPTGIQVAGQTEEVQGGGSESDSAGAVGALASPQ